MVLDVRRLGRQRTEYAHGLVGICTLQVEHTGTWVVDPVVGSCSVQTSQLRMVSVR